MFRIQEFAQLAGVTVRTLHHYDRLGLLCPASRSEAGYRLYAREDLGHLERILVLRYLGLPLREIASLLASGPGSGQPPLAETLARQAAVLRQRRAGLDRVLHAIETVRARAAQGAAGDVEPEWLLYQTILREIQMQETTKWTEMYYSAEAREAIESKRAEWTPELQEQVTDEWQTMYAEIQSAIDGGMVPASPQGKALAARWMELVSRFTGGDPAVLEGLHKLYDDRGQWPQQTIREEQRANLPRAEHMAFVRAAHAG